MFRHTNNHKIGNILVYFAMNAQPLYLTKALKLLYILDEKATKETGVPVTWLDYEAWEMGPVPREIHEEIRHDRKRENSLSDYLSYEETKNQYDGDCLLISAKIQFDKEEFTEYELDLLSRVTMEYGYSKPGELVEMLHSEGSLWSQVVNDQNLKDVFIQKSSRTDVPLRLEELVKGDPYKMAVRESAIQSLRFQEA